VDALLPHVRHNEETALGWTGWGALSSSGDRAKSLVVATDDASRLHAFAIGISRLPWIDLPPMLPEPNGSGLNTIQIQSWERRRVDRHVDQIGDCHGSAAVPFHSTAAPRWPRVDGRLESE
jgi:hypothetical protein